MNFIANEKYSTLLADLASAFMTAANSTTGMDLHDALVGVLLEADIMPESCRADLAA